MNCNFKSSLEDLGNIAKNEIKKIFDEPVKKFYSDMRKNIKILGQDMQRHESDKAVIKI